jgi:hypothetical protein
MDDAAASLQVSLNLVRDFAKTAAKRSAELAQDDATTSTNDDQMLRLLKADTAPPASCLISTM